MGVIKTLLGVVILVAILVFGYWLYATYTIASADDEMWVTVNSNMPGPLRKWSCQEVNGRFEAAAVPEHCADVWQATAAPQEETIEAESPAASAPETEAADTMAEPATEPAPEPEVTTAPEPASDTPTEAATETTTEPEAATGQPSTDSASSEPAATDASTITDAPETESSTDTTTPSNN